jgi:hypothetical protein
MRNRQFVRLPAQDVHIGGDARLGSCRVPIERRGGCRLLDRLRLGLASRSRVIEDDTAVR